MSAWLTNPNHNVLIANFISEGRESHFNDPITVGMILAREVIRSIQCRYPRTIGEGFSKAPGQFVGEEVTEAEYIKQSSKQTAGTPGSVTLADMASLVSCYTYQACETDNWSESPAWHLCEYANDLIMIRLREQSSEDFKWGTDYKPDEVIPLSKIGNDRFDIYVMRKLVAVCGSHPEAIFMDDVMLGYMEQDEAKTATPHRPRHASAA